MISRDRTDAGIAGAQALEAFSLLSRTEGIIPALETSHALAYLGVSLQPACT